MAKPTTSREFAHEDLAVLPGVGGDHEMTQCQAPVNHYLSLCLVARCGPLWQRFALLHAIHLHCFRACEFTVPAHGPSATVRCSFLGPFLAVALLSALHGARTRRLPAHGARTQWALSAVHFAPAVPLHPALQGCPHTGSLKSPSAWLPRCPRAVLLMHSSRCARIRLPTPGPSAAALARSVEVQ